MDITVYLPDEIGLWAKSAGLNLSGLLRWAVEAEKDRLETLTSTAEEAVDIELDVVDQDTGDSYTGRFRGTYITESRDVAVYLKEDKKTVILHDQAQGHVRYVDADDEDELETQLGGALDRGEYIEACNALGIKPVVDL